eukprot:6461119-Pyramimonas_sp.AAC.1
MGHHFDAAGCKACVHEAPNTFILENTYGRARVDTQWSESLQAAKACSVVAQMNMENSHGDQSIHVDN